MALDQKQVLNGCLADRFYNMWNINRTSGAGISHVENLLVKFFLFFEHPLMICVLLTGKPIRMKLYIFYFVQGFSNGLIMFSSKGFL